jgi:hypothetical protein
MTLLQERIKKYHLPSCPYEPAFDRVVVCLLPEEKAVREKAIEGGLIYKPPKILDREKRESPRAVLLAAGLTAMDELRGFGIDLGHIVWVARFSPWRHVVDTTADGDVELMFLRAGDIVGSEDVRRLLGEGKLKIKVGDEGRHQYQMDSSALPRFDPQPFPDQ